MQRQVFPLPLRTNCPAHENNPAILRNQPFHRSTPALSDKLHPPAPPGKRSQRRYKEYFEIAIRSFLLRGGTLCFQRFIDQPAHSRGGPVIRSHFASFDKQ